MKKRSSLFATALAFGVLVPAVVTPLVVSAAAPDSLVFELDGKQVKVDYADYQDVLLGENADLQSLITGKGPMAIGVVNSFIYYGDFTDLLFTNPDKNALELIDIALEATDKLVDETIKSKFEIIIGFENGKPVYSNTESPDSFEVIDIQ